MLSCGVHNRRLAITILAYSCVFTFLSVSRTLAQEALSTNARIARHSTIRLQPMINADSTDTADVRQLVLILKDAYDNSLMHNSANPNLETQDLSLESASIQLSSRILQGITSGPCESAERPADSGALERKCILDDQSGEIRELTDMLSYAASRLEIQARSASSAAATDNQRELLVARIRSMEHLYRTVFAISRLYFDKQQRDVYLQTAREQLSLARQHMDAELRIRGSSYPSDAKRMSDLSQLDAILSTL